MSAPGSDAGMALLRWHARIDKSAHVQVRPNYHIDEVSTVTDPASGLHLRHEGSALSVAKKEMRSKKRQPLKEWAPVPWGTASTGEGQARIG